MEKLKRKILKLLSEDCRLSPEKIALMLGTDASQVKAAIEEMEKSGAIVKYSAIVNEGKLSEDRVEALIEVKVTPQKSRGFDAIAEEIYRFPEVKSLYLMSGGFDFTVVIEGKSLNDVALLVSEKLSAIENVVGTATHFILKKYKIEGIVVTESDSNNRIPFHP